MTTCIADVQYIDRGYFLDINFYKLCQQSVSVTSVVDDDLMAD